MNIFKKKPALKLAKTYDVCKTDQPKITLVLLHGIASDSNTFNGFIKHFEKTKISEAVRLITFDLLGAGKSSKSNDLNYDYDEQIEALKNSIHDLKTKTPIILIGHSMGTLIAARYANLYPRLVDGLILVSPPSYREEEMRDPSFAKGMDGFAKLVGYKNPEAIKSKAFNNEIKLIVSNLENYENFVRLKQPTYVIYGELDKIIASYNLPALTRANSNLHITKTIGSHGVTPDKYDKIIKSIQYFL